MIQLSVRARHLAAAATPGLDLEYEERLEWERALHALAIAIAYCCTVAARGRNICKNILIIFTLKISWCRNKVVESSPKIQKSNLFSYPDYCLIYKNKFCPSLFGRICGSTILFWDLLTFRHRYFLWPDIMSRPDHESWMTRNSHLSKNRKIRK